MKTPLLPACLFLATSLQVPAALIWQSPMDGNANATVGPNGVANGSPTSTADRFGNPDSAVLFDGVDDFYNLGTIQSTLSAGTFAGWVRVDDLAEAERGVFAIGASGGDDTNYFSAQYNRGESSDPRFRSDVDDGNDAGSAQRLDVFSGAIESGEWMHLAVTFSVGGDLIMYLNGEVEGTTSLADSQTLESLGSWLIGAERTTERYFLGAIDDVYIYDEALSQAQIVGLIPEPGSTALVSLAGLLLLRRRRN